MFKQVVVFQHIIAFAMNKPPYQHLESLVQSISLSLFSRDFTQAESLLYEMQQALPPRVDEDASLWWGKFHFQRGKLLCDFQFR